MGLAAGIRHHRQAQHRVAAAGLAFCSGCQPVSGSAAPTPRSFVIKKAEQRYNELSGLGIAVRLICVGRKGASYFKRRPQYNVEANFSVGQSPTIKEAQAIADDIFADFVSQVRCRAFLPFWVGCVASQGHLARIPSLPLLPTHPFAPLKSVQEVDKVELIYTKFVSLISSSPVIQTLLPLTPSGEVCDVNGVCVDAAEDEIFKLTTREGQLVVESEAVSGGGGQPGVGRTQSVPFLATVSARFASCAARLVGPLPARMLCYPLLNRPLLLRPSNNTGPHRDRRPRRRPDLRAGPGPDCGRAAAALHERVAAALAAGGAGL